MSVRVTTQVFAHSQHASTLLVMLLAIADFADDDGRAYPSVGTLAVKSRTSKRQAIRLLAELEASGELKVLKNEGPRGTNVYWVRLEGVTSVSPLTSVSPVTSKAGGGDIQGTKPLTPMSPEPSMNHQEPSKSARKRAPSFDATSIAVPEWLDRELWNEWVAERRERRDPLSQRAAVMQIKDLIDMKAKGHDPAEAIRRSIRSGWKGIFPPSTVRSGERPKGDVSDSKPAWAIQAGFETRYDAENAGCTERNAHLFSNGKHQEHA